MVSIVTYTGDGSTTDYSIPFPYLDREHVVVELDDVVTSNFSFLSDTSIRLSIAPAAQTRIVVKRATPVAPLVDFTDGSTLFEADLDLADQQSRYLGEEARDRSDSALTTINNNLADVNTVAGIASDVSTVAAVDDDVTTVATNLNGINTVGTVAGIDTEVTTVAGIASDVTAVSTNNTNVTTTATNIADVNTVAGINTDVSTVAGISANVTTVANNDANVTTVATNNANVTTVAGISTDVTTVANNDANVTAVANNATDISTVAGINTSVTSVAANNTNVTTAATNIANVNTVASNITNVNNVGNINSDVSTVAGISANVTSVANDAADIGTVAGISANVTTVAGLSSSVSTLALISSDVTTVAGMSANVSTVAGISANVSTVATNLNGVDSIGTVATNISNVNAVGADIANVNTAATNLTSINSFADTYRIGATDPTTDLDAGDLFYNTTSGTLKVYSGTGWEQGVTAGSGFLPLSGGTLTGNLVFTGTETVDGRDVSVDGTKLDGIEAGADVTDAANVEPLVDAHINVSGATSGQYLGWNGTDYAWSTVDLSTKLDLAGGTMTGALVLNADPTTALGASTKQYVDTQVAGIVDSAPSTLDTLNELAAALGDDPNFATTVSTSIGTKLDASSYTAADVLTKIKTVDGSGSGLDADTLDGVQATSFLRSDQSDVMDGELILSNATWPSLKFRSSGTDNGYLQFGSNGTGYLWNTRAGQGLRLQSGNSGLTWYNGSNYYTVWHSANDGSGSGLDADLWDGNQFSSYLNQSVLTTSSPTFSTVTATNFNTTSDATLKTNVETLTGSLDAVKALRGVSFDWIENGNSEVGVIAQEVEAVIPDLVSTNDEGIKSVKYGNIVAVLIEAIKEQQEQIDALKEQLNS